TPDSRHLITCETFSDLHVYELATGKPSREFDTEIHIYNFYQAATGTRLMSLGPQGGHVWDWSTGKKVGDFPWVDSDRLLLSADGRHLLKQADGKPPLQVLDAETGKEVDRYRQLRD